MSLSNWELVVDFLSYKLSQKGRSWNEFSEGEGTTTEASGGPESHMETPRTTTDTPAHHLDSPALLGATGHGSNVDPPEATHMAAVKQVLRAACDEFDVRYQRAFSDLTAQLHVTPETAHQSFEQVARELFQGEVNWGRVVAFFAFGGALCVQSADKEMPGLVRQIATWMTSYLNGHLDPWIRDNGGWDTFAELYGNNAVAESRRGQERFQRWVVTLAGMALLGSLLFSRK